MSTEHLAGWRLRLALCALFVASFSVTTLAVWPTSAVQPLDAIAAADSQPEKLRTVLEADVGPSVSPTAAIDDSESAASPAPTLQDLAADSDPETRLEAQTLLGLVSAEVATDYQ